MRFEAVIRLTRSRKWSIATLVLGLLFLRAAWPGWMTGDSGTQWMEASGSVLVSDWHSAQLSTAWSWLGPNTHGPRGPFTLQVLCYFVGMTAIVWWAENRSAKVACGAFMLTLIAPFTWTVGFIWKDAFIISVLSLGTGILVTATVCRKTITSRVLLVLAGMVLGAAAVGRPYMLPILLAWPIAVILVLWTRDGLARASLVVCVPLVLSTASLVIVWPAVQPAYPTHIAGSTQLLDLARIECRSRPVVSSTPASGLIPRNLVVDPQKADICSEFDPYTWDYMAWLAEDTVHIRLPQSEEESSQLQSTWIRAALAHPGVIAAAKIEAWVRLLTLQDNEEVPPLETSPSAPGAVGAVAPNVRSFPSRGGVGLALLLAPAQLVYALSPTLLTGLVWLLVVPVGYAASPTGRRCFRTKPVGTVMLASIGLAWASLITLAAPAIVTRYWEPGAYMSAVGVVIMAIMGRSFQGEHRGDHAAAPSREAESVHAG